MSNLSCFNSPLKNSFLFQNTGANPLILLGVILVEQHFSTGSCGGVQSDKENGRFSEGKRSKTAQGKKYA